MEDANSPPESIPKAFYSLVIPGIPTRLIVSGSRLAARWLGSPRPASPLCGRNRIATWRAESFLLRALPASRYPRLCAIQGRGQRFREMARRTAVRSSPLPARKNVNLMLAMRADEVAHVFDHAHQIYFHLAEHFDGLASVLQAQHRMASKPPRAPVKGTV